MPQGTLSLFCNNLYGKRIWRIGICICITEPLCCNLKLIQCFRSTEPQNKIKIEKKFTLKFLIQKLDKGVEREPRAVVVRETGHHYRSVSGCADLSAERAFQRRAEPCRDLCAGNRSTEHRGGSVPGVVRNLPKGQSDWGATTKGRETAGEAGGQSRAHHAGVWRPQ